MDTTSKIQKIKDKLSSKASIIDIDTFKDMINVGLNTNMCRIKNCKNMKYNDSTYHNGKDIDFCLKHYKVIAKIFGIDVKNLKVE